MHSKLVWSFLSVVALAAGGLITGCDSDAKIAKSGVGESCDSSADCEDSLNCIQGACYKGSTGTGGGNGEGGEGNGTSGTGATGPKPAVLGGEGESCTKRADCADGLGCFNERCTKEAGGEGGEGSGGPALGRSGETCGLTSDCGAGLACLPQGDAITIKAIGSNSVGVCTPIDSGLEPSGKTCGHECVEAADCCQLPLAQKAATGASSCTELALMIEDIPNCDTATGVNGLICLSYSVYCDEQCGKNTWACERGQCEYTAKCTKTNQQVVGGCPQYSRDGGVLSIICNKASKCAPEAVTVTGCKKDSDCDDENPTVADDATDTCEAGECTCNADNGGCYRKCSEDLDCPLRYKCDTEETSLCVPEAACTTDAYCITQSGDIRATCNNGTCSVPCEHDIDCNPGGLTNGYFSYLCGPEKTCVPLGCSSDDECPAIGDGVHGFCAEEPAPAPGASVAISAITD